jgi:hypothetical protein
MSVAKSRFRPTIWHSGGGKKAQKAGLSRSAGNFTPKSGFVMHVFREFESYPIPIGITRILYPEALAATVLALSVGAE